MRAMTLVEVMVAASVLLLVLAALLGSQIFAIKSQRRATENITLYALANSICDQVCGLGYDEVDTWVKKGNRTPPEGTAIIAINDPASGKQLPVRLTHGVATELKDYRTQSGLDLRLKTDYSLHNGSITGMDRMSSLTSASGSAQYSTVRNLQVRVTAAPVRGISAYLVTTNISFTDGFNRQSTVTVGRLVSNLSGYANIF